MAKTKKNEHFRDAETGQYVTPEYAKQNKKTTVKETDPVKPKKK